MITRIHQQVADLSVQAKEAWIQKNHGKAIGLVLAARVLAVALFALNALVIALTPFRYLVQSFILVHFARKAPFPEGTPKALSDWCRADLGLQFVGIIQAVGSILSPELFCNTFALQKVIYRQSIAMDITIARLNDKDLEEFKQTLAIVNVPFNRQEFEVLLQKAWQQNATNENQKSPYGQPNIQLTLLQSHREASVKYILSKIQALPERIRQDAKDRIRIQLLELATKPEKLTSVEAERFELFGKIESRAYFAAKAIMNAPKVIPNKPKTTPVGAAIPSAKIDPIAFARKIQDEEDAETARKIQAQIDLDTAMNAFQTPGNRKKPNGTPSPNIPKGMYGTKDDFDRVLKVDSMDQNKAVVKHLEKHDLAFSLSMLNSLKKARVDLIAKKIYTDEQLDCPFGDELYSIWHMGVYKFYLPDNQKSAATPIWKAPIKKMLVDRMNDLREKLKRTNDCSSATALLVELINNGKTPDIEKKLEALRTKNKKTAKFVDGIYITCEEFKEVKKLVDLQEDLIKSIAEFQKHNNTVGQDLLFDLVARNGETKENSPIRAKLKEEHPDVEKAVGKIFNDIVALVKFYEKSLFNHNDKQNGLDWDTAFVSPNAKPAQPVAAPPSIKPPAPARKK